MSLWLLVVGYLLIFALLIARLLGSRRKPKQEPASTPRCIEAAEACPAVRQDAAEDAPLFELIGVTKRHRAGGNQVTVFDDAHYVAPCTAGMLGIQGESGCGKSTLLHLLGGLDTPTQGVVRVLGTPLSKCSRQLASHRRQVGLVLQEQNLIDHLSARDNIAMPLALHGMPWNEAYARAARWLAALDLVDCADRKPARLSGGQQQRVAIARALAAEARLILADEPTSALDARNAEQVCTTLRRVAHEFGTAVVLVSHDPNVLARCDHVVRCDAGRLLTAGAPAPVALSSLPSDPEPIPQP